MLSFPISASLMIVTVFKNLWKIQTGGKIPQSSRASCSHAHFAYLFPTGAERKGEMLAPVTQTKAWAHQSEFQQGRKTAAGCWNVQSWTRQNWLCLSGGCFASSAVPTLTLSPTSRRHGFHPVRDHGSPEAAVPGSEPWPEGRPHGGGGGRVQHQPHAGLHLLQHQPGTIPAAARSHVSLFGTCRCAEIFEFAVCLTLKVQHVVFGELKWHHVVTL